MQQEVEVINYFGKTLKASASNLYYIFKTEFELIFEDVKCVRYTLKIAKQLKMLIQEQGFKESVDLIIWSMKNWTKIAKELKIKSYPTPGIIYGFRYSLLKLKNSTSSKKYVNDKDNNVNKRASKNAFFINN